MRKIRLEIEELAVESFATDGRGTARGTVEGLSLTYGTNIDCTENCPSMQTGNEGCPSCQESGNASCVGLCPGDSFTCYTCGVLTGQAVLFPEC